MHLALQPLSSASFQIFQINVTELKILTGTRGRPVGYLENGIEDMNSGLPRNKSRHGQLQGGGLEPGTLQFKHMIWVVPDSNDIAWNIWQYLYR